MTATAQAPTNGATAAPQFPMAERLLEKINEGNPRHRAMPADMRAKFDLAEVMFKSKLVPEGYDSVEKVYMALQQGDELGLSPTAALSQIAVVKGKPSLMYMGMLAVIQSSGKLEDYREDYDAEGCTVTMKRRGIPTPYVGRFTYDDVKRAGLQGQTLHSKYPRDGVRNRGGMRAARPGFADVLCGIPLEDEAEEEAADRQAAKAAIWILRAEDVTALKRLIAAKKIPGDDLKAIAQAATGGRQIAVGANGVPDYSRAEWEAYEAAVRSWGAKATPSKAPAPAAAPAPTGKPFADRLADLAQTYNAPPERMAKAAALAKVDLEAMTEAGLEDMSNALTALDQADEERASARE